VPFLFACGTFAATVAMCWSLVVGTGSWQNLIFATSLAALTYLLLDKARWRWSHIRHGLRCIRRFEFGPEAPFALKVGPVCGLGRALIHLKVGSADAIFPATSGGPCELRVSEYNSVALIDELGLDVKTGSGTLASTFAEHVVENPGRWNLQFDVICPGGTAGRRWCLTVRIWGRCTNLEIPTEALISYLQGGLRVSGFEVILGEAGESGRDAAQRDGATR